MREEIEFRIPEKSAVEWLRPDQGVRIGSGLVIRKYQVLTNDPGFDRVGEAERTLKTQGRSFFTGWCSHKKYTGKELADAALFKLNITSVFEPAGEECGTTYDETTACPICGAGARQSSELFLPGNRIPKKTDFSKTIAGEIVVSRRLVALFESAGVRGVHFGPIRRSPRGAPFDQWAQLVVPTHDADVFSPTRAGNDPFDVDGKLGRCPASDVLGLSLLSELTIRVGGEPLDVRCSKQFIGTRRGLLRPQWIVLVSQKVRKLIESKGLRGCELEVAYLA
jgi:hypothetical protein